MTTTPVTVAPATAHHAAPIGSVLADAFHDDPVGRWIAPDLDTRPVRLSRFFAIWAAAFTIPHGEVLKAGDVGAALWLPPGRWQVPRLVLMRQLPQLGSIFGRRTPLLLRGLNRLEHHHPREPHWFLPLMGVTRDRQGEGIGTALLAAVLRRCDDEGTPAYLEATCERNRDLYARHGFRIQQEVRLPDGPPLWAMWREPQQVQR